MDFPKSNSGESKPVGEAALDQEEELLPSIDPRLVDAVQNPQFRRIVLRMEEKIREFILNPDLHEIELPHFNSSYLREITSLLARYYGLEPLSAESTRIFSRESPNCRMPSLTLSGILPAEPEEELMVGSKFIGIFTILKRQSGCTLSRNLPEPKTRRRSLERRGEEYYKARAKIFNESVSSSSISPVVSRSMSPVQSEIIRDGGEDGAGGSRMIRIPLHNPGANLNLNQTDSRPGRRITPQQLHVNEQAPTLYNASNFLYQTMQYPSMQYGQPALPPYGGSVYPYVLEPHGSYPMYQYYPYFASDPLYNPAYVSYMPWPTVPSMQSLYRGLYNLEYVSYMPWPTLRSTQSLYQGLYTPVYSSYMPWPTLPSTQSLYQGLYNPAYSSYMQLPLLPTTQTLMQEALYFQPSVTDSDELLQYYGASIERPSRPPLDPYEASGSPSTLAPPSQPYNPGNSTYMQRSMPQCTQPRESTRMPRENNETGRSGRRGTNASRQTRGGEEGVDKQRQGLE